MSQNSMTLAPRPNTSLCAMKSVVLHFIFKTCSRDVIFFELNIRSLIIHFPLPESQDCHSNIAGKAGREIECSCGMQINETKTVFVVDG